MPRLKKEKIKEPNFAELTIHESTAVFTDSKTNARTIALPFRLPDGTSAVLMVCRLKDDVWVPSKEIKSIKITYED